MNLTRLIILAGLGSTLITLATILLRHPRFDTGDIALALGAFFFGANLPPSIFLCIYAFTPDEAITKTRLAGYEWYLFFAGLAAFLFAAVELWNVIRRAYKKEPT